MAGRNAGLDGLRGIAVLLTYLVHYCGSYLATFRGGNPNSIELAGWADPFDKVMYLLFRSHHGVYIFFVLSGFLIARITLREGFAYLDFVRNRLVRIYPAFLVAFAACLLVGLALRLPPPSWRDVALNLVFLNGYPPLGVNVIIFNNVTWSLFYEMAFYLTFPGVVMLARRFGFPLVGCIVLSGVVVAYLPMLFGFYSEFFLFLFAGALIGSLPAEAVKRVAGSFPDVIVLALYLLVTSLMAASYLTTAQFLYLFALVACVLVCKAVAAEGLLAQALSWRPLVYLGRISYSFYLLHSVALALMFGVWFRLGSVRFSPMLDALYHGALGFIGSLALAWVSYHLAESFYFRRREASTGRDRGAVHAPVENAV